MPRIDSVLNVELDLDYKKVTFSVKDTGTELKNAALNFNNKYYLPVIIF